MSTTPSALNTGLSDAASGLGIYAGLERGGLQGDVGALASAGSLAGKLGGNSTLTGAAGDVGDVLGIYSGIQSGGLAGYGMSAADTAKLAGSLTGDTALSTVGGYIAAPLSLYEFGKNWQSGATGSDALGGAEAGASVGSIAGPVGTVIGGLVGAAAGALSSAFGGGKVDPETAADKGMQSQYTTAYDANPQAATAALSNLNPQQSFESLAGYFDAKNNTAGHSQPIEQTFGRMNEGNFVNDIAGQINSDYTSGAITPGESASQIYSSEISPWISSQTGGQGILGPTSGEGGVISGDIQNLIGAYTSGQLTSATPIGVSGQQDSSLPTFDGLGAYAGSAAPAATGAATSNTNPDAVRTNIQHAPMARAATGGAMRKLRHFDDGGSTDFLSDDLGDLGSGNDQGLNLSNIFSGVTPAFDTGYSSSTDPNAAAISANQPSGSGTSSSSSSSGKGLTGLLQGLGLSAGTASTLASLGVTAASLAPIIGALTGSTGKGATQPTLPSQYTGAIAPVSTPTMSRTQNPSYQSMSPAQWLHYGEMPEQQFYNNNQTPTTSMSPTATPQAATPAAPNAGQNPNTPIGAYGTPNANLVASQSAYGTPQTNTPAAQAAYGTSSSNLAAALAAYNSSGMNPSAPQQASMAGPALNSISAPNMPTPQPITQRPTMMARGGPAYMTQSPYQSAMSSHVRGPGDGTSDDINAKLSDGEYVMDAPTVSLIGNGSNEAGARKLDDMRHNVRVHAGQKLVRGKQPMHALPPEQYMSAE